MGGEFFQEFGINQSKNDKLGTQSLVDTVARVPGEFCLALFRVNKLTLSISYHVAAYF